MKGMLSCIESKLLRIPKNLFDNIPKNLCRDVIGRGRFNMPSYHDHLELLTNQMQIILKENRKATSSKDLHLIKISTFIQYLEEKLTAINTSAFNNSVSLSIKQIPFVSDSPDFVYVLGKRHAYLNADDKRVDWKKNCEHNGESNRDITFVCNLS